MFKNYMNDLKLSKLSYLLETIEIRDFSSKIKAFNKIRKMKLTKEMGLLILDNTNFDAHSSGTDFDISISLISLLFVNYYDEYSDKLYSIYPKLTLENKYELLNLLSNTNNESAVLLYKKILLKYGKELDNIPIGRLSYSKDNYKLLFPDLFKVLGYDIKRNNVLLLLNDFINNNLVLEKDIKKHKKTIQNSIINILKQACNYKFSKDENIMQNKDYLNLRIYLEAVTNIEFYVTSKDTKTYLDKLLKKKDNQLKLFILENYIKKGKDLSKINLNSIAKDVLSRYPLYSFLMFYNLERLMPKKYANNLALSESDLFINFAIENKYEVLPENLEFVEEKIYNDYKYYVYKFETDFNYYDEVKDPATDYILKTTSIDKVVKENSKVYYLGISGGFNKELDPSLIEKNLDRLSVKKITDEDLEKQIESLLPKKEISLSSIKDKKKSFVKLYKKQKIDKITDEEKDKKIKEDKVTNEIEIEEVEKKRSILRIIFSFNTFLFLICLAFVGAVLILLSYVNGMDILDLKKNNIHNVIAPSLKKVELKKENQEKFTEISFRDIFRQGESEYYVLMFTKKKETMYYFYLNTLIENNYRVYYVDLSKEENKALYNGNETGFVIKDDTWLKVKDGEYEFYVVVKTNILKELKDYVDSINKKKEEEAAIKKAEEEAKKQAKQKEEKKEKSSTKNKES